MATLPAEVFFCFTINNIIIYLGKAPKGGVTCYMDRNIVPALLGTIFCFISTISSIQYLAPYSITEFNKFGFILLKAWGVLTSGSPERYWLISSLLLAIIGAVVSLLIILHLINYLSDECNSDSLGLKILLAVWIILLGANILLSVYYLLFIILLIIAFGILLFIIATGPNNYGGGGPVYVKGHTRKGSYVRSHYRRRPRRF